MAESGSAESFSLFSSYCFSLGACNVEAGATVLIALLACRNSDRQLSLLKLEPWGSDDAAHGARFTSAQLLRIQCNRLENTQSRSPRASPAPSRRAAACGIRRNWWASCP